MRRPARRPLLGAILLVALGLRLWGIDWQLPALLYDDEAKYVLAASFSARGIENTPPDYRNPSLFRHVLDLEYRALLALGLERGSGRPDADGELLARHYLLARLTAALLGAASVGLLYLLGCRAFGPGVGLLAAALLAVNFLHVHWSHFGVNGVPAGFLMLAALLPSVGLFGRASGRRFLLAGLLGGLATAAKYNFGIVLIVPLVALALLAARRPSPRRLLGGAALLGLGAVGGLLLGMPELLWDFDAVREGFLRQAALGDQRWTGQEPGPVPLLYGQALLRAFGLPGLLAAALGLGLALARRGAGPLAPARANARLALALCPLAYLVYMARTELFFAHFALPAVLLLCLFGASGLVWGWSWVPVGRPGLALAVVVCLAVLLPPTILSIRLDLLAGQTDTRVLAERWLLANVPPGTKLAAQSYSVPNTPPASRLRQAFDFTSFALLYDPSQLNRLACAGNRYVLTSSFQEERQRELSRQRRASGFELLAQQGRLVAAFRPGPGESDVPSHLDDSTLPFWQLERYARPGSTVRVYELPPGVCRSA